MALLFSYRNKNIDYVVIGIDTAKQLEEHIHTVTKLKNYEECLKKIKEDFFAMDINKNIISPNLWESLKK